MTKRYDLRIDISPQRDYLPFDPDAKCITVCKWQWQGREDIEGVDQETGVGDYISMREAQDILNSYEFQEGVPKNKQKDALPEFRRGHMVGGLKNDDQKTQPPIVAFDIDHKTKYKDGKDENTWLSNEQIGDAVFEILSEIGILVWRSFSGTGIGGFIYVPNIDMVAPEEGGPTTDHRKVALEVFRLLNAEVKKRYPTAPHIEFDEAQAKPTQARYIAPQTEERVVNPNPVAFVVNKVEKIYLTHEEGVPMYNHSNEAVEGSIQYKFNEANPIHETLLECGFRKVGHDRYYHPRSGNVGSTGKLFPDGFKVYCTNFHPKSPTMDSFHLVAHKKGMSPAEFRQELIATGYTDDELDTTGILWEISMSDTTEELAAIAHRLKHYTNSQKKSVFDQADFQTPELRRAFEVYLGFTEFILTADQEVELEEGERVSDVFPEILKASEKHNHLVVWANTSLGKTYAIFDHFLNKDTSKRILFIAPLSVIVIQQGKKYKNNPDVLWLTSEQDKKKMAGARHKRIVIATPQQAAKVLKEYVSFDYIIKDEIHSDITTQSYRRSTYAELNSAIQLWQEAQPDLKIIGLTGTPIRELKKMGYHLFRVKDKNPVNVVKQRVCNREPIQILIKHQRTVKGKALYRINEKSTIDMFQEWLLDHGYKKEEVVVLKSELKSGDDFQKLAEEDKFRPEVKVVITTSLIDEGLSIHDEGFTDIVFLENRQTYSPRPEPLKQFLNRSRDMDESTELFYYIRVGKHETPSDYTDQYYENLDILENEQRDLKESKYINSLSLEKFYFDDVTSKKVDKYYLAYHESSQFFGSLNLEEFNFYAEQNFNIRFEVDRDWDVEEDERVDLKGYKQMNKKDKVKMAEFFREYAYSDQIESILLECSKDIALKEKIMMDLGIVEGNYDDIVANVVPKEHKTFSTLVSYKIRMEELGFDPMEYMFTKSDTLESARALSQKTRLMQDILTIEKVGELNRDELVDSDNLKAFLKDVGDREYLDRRDMIAAWKKLFKLNETKQTQTTAIIHLIEHYTDWRYDNKKSRFRKDPDKETMLWKDKGISRAEAKQMKLEIEEETNTLKVVA